MDKDSFTIHIKTEDVYKDIADDLIRHIMPSRDHYQQEKIKKLLE